MSDTSPLRSLQAIDRIGLIHQVYGQAFVPPAVVAELAIARVGLSALRVSEYSFLLVRAPGDTGTVARLSKELDPGESEALALALELRAERVLVDDFDGRRVARRLGLHTIGVLGLLVQAKRAGLVDRVAPLIDQLVARINFRVSTSVREVILRDAGE